MVVDATSNKVVSVLDKSGSCAILALFVDDMCYIANIGDCRAVIFSSNGEGARDLSTDHTPANPHEEQRIKVAGGYTQQKPDSGVVRVYPGGLSCTRSFGDATAKCQETYGNPDVVTAVPEIEELRINSEHDFIVMACDGIYDRLSSEEVVEAVQLGT